jgi:hypothetical protein
MDIPRPRGDFVAPGKNESDICFSDHLLLNCILHHLKSSARVDGQSKRELMDDF